jgi:hypothetical protein
VKKAKETTMTMTMTMNAMHRSNYTAPAVAETMSGQPEVLEVVARTSGTWIRLLAVDTKNLLACER